MGFFAPRARRLTAWTSLAALVTVLTLPMLPGVHTSAQAEADCAGLSRPGVYLAIDADAALPTRSDHCVMCHWLRAARSATVYPVAAADPSLTYQPVGVRPTISVAGRLLVLEGPSRAPPSVA